MSKCEKQECLVISVYKNHSKAFHYSIWYGSNFLGEVVEDEIMQLLGASDTKKFYKENKVNFLVPKSLIQNLVKKPKYY
jgi:hypothetical protein